jgi:hypothetical protein
MFSALIVSLFYAVKLAFLHKVRCFIMQKEGACYRIPGLEGIEIGLGCAHSVFRSVIALSVYVPENQQGAIHSRTPH